ncbi:MAG: hypothetical protein CMH53_06225 [Myxococcales bacterium]|nr:hypothetical protein [Myxococcales bacterium]
MTAHPPDSSQHTVRLSWSGEQLLWCALALALRLPKLEASEPWLDEACSLELANQGPLTLLQTLITTDASPHPPLFFSLLSLSTTLLGEGLVAARLVSLLSGVLLVALSAYVANQLIGRRAARLAALVTALSPLAIHYSVEIRGYSLVSVLSLLYGLTLVRHLYQPDRVAIFPSLLCFGLATLTHYYALALLLLPVWIGLGSVDRRIWLRATFALCFVAVPSASMAVAQLLKGAGGGAWISAFHVSALIDSFAAFSLGTEMPHYLGQVAVIEVPDWVHYCGLSWTALGLVAALFVKSREPGVRKMLYGVMVIVIAAPALGSLWRPMYLAGRYELAAMVPAQVLAVCGWWQLVKRASLASWARYALHFGVVLVLSSFMLPAYLQVQTQQPFEQIARQIGAHSTTKTLVIHTHLTAPPVDWQLRQSHFGGSTMVFPESQAQHRCWHKPMNTSRLAQARVEAQALPSGLVYARVQRVFITQTLRRGRPTRSARILIHALRNAGWMHRQSQAFGSYGLTAMDAPNAKMNTP